MKKNILKIILLTLFLLPIISFSAGEKIEYSYLPQSLVKMNADSLAGFIKQIYIYSLGIVGIVAFGAVIYGAFLRMFYSGNSGKVREGDDWIKGAIYGLALLFGAYLILNTINPDLVNLKGQDPKEKLKELSEKYTIKGADYSGFGIGEELEPLHEGIENTDSEARRKVATAVNMSYAKPCAPGESKGCVSFEGVKNITLQEMGAIADVIGSNNVVITSVTEGSHAQGENSHANGYKFDFVPNRDITNDLKKAGFTQAGTRTDIDGKTQLPVYVNPKTGAKYVWEPAIIQDGKKVRGAHWDVQAQDVKSGTW